MGLIGILNIVQVDKLVATIQWVVDNENLSKRLLFVNMVTDAIFVSVVIVIVTRHEIDLINII